MNMYKKFKKTRWFTQARLAYMLRVAPSTISKALSKIEQSKSESFRKKHKTAIGGVVFLYHRSVVLQMCELMMLNNDVAYSIYMKSIYDMGNKRSVISRMHRAESTVRMMYSLYPEKAKRCEILTMSRLTPTIKGISDDLDIPEDVIKNVIDAYEHREPNQLTLVELFDIP